MSSFTILVPSITDATFSPNPVSARGNVSLAVSIVEIEVILEPYFYMSGEIYSGEV